MIKLIDNPYHLNYNLLINNGVDMFQTYAKKYQLNLRELTQEQKLQFKYY